MVYVTFFRKLDIRFGISSSISLGQCTVFVPDPVGIAGLDWLRFEGRLLIGLGVVGWCRMGLRLVALRLRLWRGGCAVGGRWFPGLLIWSWSGLILWGSVPGQGLPPGARAMTGVGVRLLRLGGLGIGRHSHGLWIVSWKWLG